MEKPGYAGIQSIIRGEDRIDQTIANLKSDLRKAFDERVALVETKYKRVSEENEKLHHERLVLAKEI